MRNDRPSGSASGFTLIEVVTVLAVLSILAGAVVPLANAAREGERSVAVELELELIAAALERHYADHSRFPNRIDELGFLRDYVTSSVDHRLIDDDWADDARYRYQLLRSPDRARLHSVGPDRRDRGFGREELKLEVSGAVPGNQRTREHLRLVGAALERWTRHGTPALTGDWDRDRAVLGLSVGLTRDGFGTALRLDPLFLSLTSAGADRRFGTTDDLEL